MSTVWHSKYALSANVIHRLIKPLQKEDIFSATCCELSAQTCRDAAVAAATASSLQKRQEGAVGREMASTGTIYFAEEYLDVPVHWSFPVSPSSLAASTSQEPARCCQGPTFAGEIHLLCRWEPTSPSQAAQANIAESKTRGTLLPKPQNPNKHKPFVLPSPVTRESERGQTNSSQGPFSLWVQKRPKKKPQRTEQIRYKCHKNF